MRGKACRRGGGRTSGAEIADEPAGQAGAENRIAAADGRNGAQDVVAVGAFEQIAASARSHGLEDVFVLIEHREDEHPDVRTFGDDATGGFDAIEPRHVDIHDNDVRLVA